MFAPGTCLLGKYRIERVLGEGGMGHVVLAQHLELEQPVAIKVLLPELVRKQDIVDRFLREARAAVRLRGEHITRVYDVGRLDDGTPFLVMEYLEGRDLSALTRERGRLPGDEAVDYLLQACEALAEAHAQGMVHRDIKPSNLFIVRGPAGQPLLKVLDFGIAKAPTDLDHGATSTQAVLGTPAYMSPEQMRSSKYVDARTDIWSLGVVLYELVSGVRPFQADSFASLCLKVAMEPTPPIDPALIPTGLAAVIERCLEKDYGRRYQNVAELAAALAAFSRSPGDAARCVERATHTLGLAAVPIEPAPAGVGATAPTPRVGPSPTAPPPPRPTPVAAAPLTPLSGERALTPPPHRRWGVAVGFVIAAVLALLVSWLVIPSGDPTPEPAAPAQIEVVDAGPTTTAAEPDDLVRADDVTVPPPDAAPVDARPAPVAVDAAPVDARRRRPRRVRPTPEPDPFEQQF